MNKRGAGAEPLPGYKGGALVGLRAKPYRSNRRFAVGDINQINLFKHFIRHIFKYTTVKPNARVKLAYVRNAISRFCILKKIPFAVVW